MDKEKAIEKVLCIFEKKFKSLKLEKCCGQRRVIYKDGCDKTIMLEESHIYVPEVREPKWFLGIFLGNVVVKNTNTFQLQESMQELMISASMKRLKR